MNPWEYMPVDRAFGALNIIVCEVLLYDIIKNIPFNCTCGRPDKYNDVVRDENIFKKFSRVIVNVILLLCNDNERNGMPCFEIRSEETWKSYVIIPGSGLPTRNLENLHTKFDSLI